jgi:hypothetical protein
VYDEINCKGIKDTSSCIAMLALTLYADQWTSMVMKTKHAAKTMSTYEMIMIASS